MLFQELSNGFNDFTPSIALDFEAIINVFDSQSNKKTEKYITPQEFDTLLSLIKENIS